MRSAAWRRLFAWYVPIAACCEISSNGQLVECVRLCRLRLFQAAVIVGGVLLLSSDVFVEKHAVVLVYTALHAASLTLVLMTPGLLRAVSYVDQ